jgi:hypothetical protein
VSWLIRRLRQARRQEAGYVVILTAILLPTVFIGCAAIGVDSAGWYAFAQEEQKAADAAALAGVPYLPYDLPSATTKAQSVAATNGFDDAASNVTVTVGLGARETQLKVTITATMRNTFGTAIGVPTATITRSAVADYQGPQPMGSPCNTFGNEPNGGTGGSSPTPTGTAEGAAPFSNCTRTPTFWANIEGPQTGKIQGDEFQTINCENATYPVDGCSGSSNSEYTDFGYFFVVKVQPSAVGTPISLQLYDPEFANTSSNCGYLPSSASFSGSGNANPYVTMADATDRYSKNGTNYATYCTGDQFPRTDTNITSTPTPMTTTFVLRHQIDSQDPTRAAVESDTGGNPCVKQYGGYTPAYSGGSFSWSANTLLSSSGSYNAQLAQVFHNWTTMCTFTPDVAGDYYLQVRSNVSSGGSCNGILCSGNPAASAATGNTTTGEGSNAFAMRAVTQSGQENSVAVAGYSHMPISINADTATATFNLIRVLPGAAGQFISFGYFDAGDASAAGSVKVLPPTDATGSITTNPFPGNCAAVGGSAGSGQSLSNCNAPLTQSGGVSKNNGKLETITVPIPSDYSCNYNSFGGCWYRVQIAFGTGSVHDVTTWNATVVGDPVRLVQ